MKSRADYRIDTSFYRYVLGHFCTGVTIVAAPGPVGFTCQSFASLSLDPPLVVFSVGVGSQSWPGIERAGVFCVNILSAEQEKVCRSFAISGGDKFDGLDWSPSPVTGSPRLPGSLAWIDCAVESVYPGGDHRIVVGRVKTLEVVEPETAPLLFYAAGLRGLDG